MGFLEARSDWVRNLAGSGVEIVASGDEGQLEKLIQWAHKGPPMAEVTGVKVESLSTEPSFNTFEAIH